MRAFGMTLLAGALLGTFGCGCCNPPPPVAYYPQPRSAVCPASAPCAPSIQPGGAIQPIPSSSLPASGAPVSGVPASSAPYVVPGASLPSG